MDKLVKGPTSTSFDFSGEAWESFILKRGVYDATIVGVRVSSKDSGAWVVITFEVVEEDGEVRQINDLSLLGAPPSSSRYEEMAKGTGRVKTILETNGRPISFGSPDKVEKALLGCRVSIMVGHRTQYGLKVPVVDRVLGPASNAGTSTQAAE